MTIKKLIDVLTKTAKKLPNINYVNVGNVYDLNSKPDVDYSLIYLTYQNSEVNENEVRHNIVMFYIDRLTDGFDNRLDIQSDGIKTITNIVNTIVNLEDVEVDMPMAFTPFNQRFAEDCAGVFTTITFIVDGDGNCHFD